jgi:hypothetical protein
MTLARELARVWVKSLRRRAADSIGSDLRVGSASLGEDEGLPNGGPWSANSPTEPSCGRTVAGGKQATPIETVIQRSAGAFNSVALISSSDTRWRACGPTHKTARGTAWPATCLSECEA